MGEGIVGKNSDVVTNLEGEFTNVMNDITTDIVAEGSKPITNAMQEHIIEFHLSGQELVDFNSMFGEYYAETVREIDSVGWIILFVFIGLVATAIAGTTENHLIQKGYTVTIFFGLSTVGGALSWYLLDWGSAYWFMGIIGAGTVFVVTLLLIHICKKRAGPKPVMMIAIV